MAIKNTLCEKRPENEARNKNAHVGHARKLRGGHNGHPKVEQSVGRLMLERVAGFVRGDADSGDRPAMKVVGREKQRALGRVVMVGQMAGDFLHRHVVEAGAVENFARGFRAGHAGFHRHPAVFAVSRGQFDLRPDADEQPRQGEH